MDPRANDPTRPVPPPTAGAAPRPATPPAATTPPADPSAPEPIHPPLPPGVTPTFAHARPASKPLGALPLLLLAGAMVAVALSIVNWTQAPPALSEVIFLEGEAYSLERALAVGDRLAPAAPVRLVDDARCFIQQPSGMVLRLSNQAQVALGAPNAPLDVLAGRLDAEPALGMEDLVDLAPAQRMSLPDGAKLVVKARHYSLSVDAKRSTLAVIDGQAEVTSGGTVERIGSNQGSVIEAGKAPVRVDLPAAPMVTAPKPNERLARVTLAVACQPVAGAVRYEWEARNARGLAATQATLDAPSGALTRLPEDGRYAIRVRAVSQEGLAGAWSAPVNVSLSLWVKLDSLTKLAHNYQLNGHHAEALDHAERGLAVWPESPQLLRVQSLVLAATNRRSEAVAIARTMAGNRERGARDAHIALIGELRRLYPEDAEVQSLVAPEQPPR